MLIKTLLILIALTASHISDVSIVSAQGKMSAAQKKLLHADQEFSRTSVKKGAAAAFYLYLTDNAMQLPEGSFPIYGKKAIFDTMMQGNYALSWTPIKAEVAESGELGWTWGKFIVVVFKEDGTQSTGFGKYLNIWNKDADGNWKVAVDMGNQSPSPN